MKIILKKASPMSTSHLRPHGRYSLNSRRYLASIAFNDSDRREFFSHQSLNVSFTVSLGWGNSKLCSYQR